MSERVRILELIEAGEIDVEEGARRLEALAGEGSASATPTSPVTPVPRPKSVQALSQIVFWVGVALVTIGGFLVAAVYAWEIAAGWQVFGWVLFIFGLLTLAAGWWVRQASWFSVRVKQPDGPNISFAFPLPLVLLVWGVRIAKPFVPQLRKTAVDELILAMRDELKNGHPLVVNVDEGEDGEQVQVYFG